MPVFNAELYVGAAINSILSQKYKDYEFIIIDDGSTDRTHAIIQSFKDPRITVLCNSSNLGVTKSLNIALNHCKGTYIARQDADDISLPARLQRQYQFLESNPTFYLVGTRCGLIDMAGKDMLADYDIPIHPIAVRWHLMFRNPFIHSSVMFRRAAIDRLGGYDEAFIRAQDFEMWSRISRQFLSTNLADVLVKHRYKYGSVVSKIVNRVPPEENIVGMNLSAFLERTDIPPEWPFLINKIRRKEEITDERELLKALEMLTTIKVTFFHLNKDAHTFEAIFRQLASSFFWIAYCAAPYNKTIARQAYNLAEKTGGLEIGKYDKLLFTLKLLSHAKLYKKINDIKMRLRQSKRQSPI